MPLSIFAPALNFVCRFIQRLGDLRMADKIQKLPQVINETGLCRSSIYASIAEGTFPKQIKLGLRSVGWLESEIKIWLADKVKVRDENKNTTINHK